MSRSRLFYDPMGLNQLIKRQEGEEKIYVKEKRYMGEGEGGFRGDGGR